MAVSLRLAEAYVDVRADLTRLTADLAKARSMLAGLGAGGAGGLGASVVRGVAPVGAAVEQAVATGMARGVAQGAAKAPAGMVGLASLQVSGLKLQTSLANAAAKTNAQATAQSARQAADLDAIQDRYIKRDYDRRVRHEAQKQVAVERSLAQMGAGPRVERAGLGLGRFLGLGGEPGGTGAATGRGGGFLGGMGQVAGGMLMARGMEAALSAPVRIGEAMFDAAKKASDLGESVSKVNVTFGPAAGEVIGKTDQLAERFGVIKKEALDAAAAFGLMALASGQTKEQAAATGNRFVQMGLDIASFHNISNEEAFEKLRSGLAGEIEPLRQIGILLSEDAVQAKALQMGLVGTKAESKHLTQQQKVAVRTELIAEGMGPAMGDLERTAGSAANQLRKLTGDMENLTTEFGNELQDALRAGLGLARDLGKAIADVTGKGAPKAVGEVVKASVDAARTAVQGEGPGLMGRLNLGLAQAMSAAFGKMGLGENFGGVKDAAEAMQRDLEGGSAAAAGMKLAAGPPTGEEQIAAMEKSGVPAQLELAAQSRAVAAAMAGAATTEALGPGQGAEARPGLALALEEDRKQAAMLAAEAAAREEERAGVLTGRGAVFARPGGIPEVSDFRKKFMGADEKAEIERRQAMEFIARPKEEKARPSQMFSDPADYATHAIQAALSVKDDSPKQTAEATKKGAVLLQTLVDAIVPATKITPGAPNKGMFIFQHEGA